MPWKQKKTSKFIGKKLVYLPHTQHNTSHHTEQTASNTSCMDTSQNYTQFISPITQSFSPTSSEYSLTSGPYSLSPSQSPVNPLSMRAINPCVLNTFSQVNSNKPLTKEHQNSISSLMSSPQSYDISSQSSYQWSPINSAPSNFNSSSSQNRSQCTPLHHRITSFSSQYSSVHQHHQITSPIPILH